MSPPADRSALSGLTTRQQAEQDEALRSLGLQPLEHDLPAADTPQAIDVWPDNWDAARLFAAMQTQRICAGSGVTVGLRYEALDAVERRLGIPADDSARVFGQLEVMVDVLLHHQAERLAALN